MQHYAIDDFLINAINRKLTTNLLLLNDIEQKFSLSKGVGINIFKHLVYWKKIQIDIQNPIDMARRCDATYMA